MRRHTPGHATYRVMNGIVCGGSTAVDVRSGISVDFNGLNQFLRSPTLQLFTTWRGTEYTLVLVGYGFLAVPALVVVRVVVSLLLKVARLLGRRNADPVALP
jgi:hypothetical protein